jgi:hypothetical protein
MKPRLTQIAAAALLMTLGSIGGFALWHHIKTGRTKLQSAAACESALKEMHRAHDGDTRLAGMLSESHTRYVWTGATAEGITISTMNRTEDEGATDIRKVRLTHQEARGLIRYLEILEAEGKLQ